MVGHIVFDPSSISVDQMQLPAVGQQEGGGKRRSVIPLVTKKADLDPVPVEAKTDAVKEMVDKPQEVKKALGIKEPAKGRKTVIVKPCDLEGRRCSTAVPTKKKKSDSLGFY
jgi:hypothetical protein